MKTLTAGGGQSCSLLSFRAAGMCLMSEIRNTQEPGGKPTGPLRAKLLTLLGGTLIVASVVVFLAWLIREG